MVDSQTEECATLSPVDAAPPQCQFFVVRKKRLCRMTVRPGRGYCGEHEPQPTLSTGQSDTRIPCPNDPKHTCYASKLQKHLSICNAREGERPPYIVPGVNATDADDAAPSPAPAAAAPRRTLSEVPRHMLLQLLEKVDRLYEEYVKDNITELAEREIHPAVAAEFEAADRAESSRRHLRQVSSLLWLAADAGLVRDHTCFVELGAGKGQLAFYAWRAWCARTRSRLLLVDRASLRHKRDNKLRDLANTAQEERLEAGDAEGAEAAGAEGEAPSTRLRADLADLALQHVPAAQACAGIVGFAKHLCGVATDYALRCLTAAALRGRVRGLLIATCCHHRCLATSYTGRRDLQELGLEEWELEILFGVVSWGTCGDGRPRALRAAASAPVPEPAGDDDSQTKPEWSEQLLSSAAWRARAGLRAKALLDWGRARALRRAGLRPRLLRHVPASVSPENLVLLATLH